MVNTFLLLADFIESAKLLDDARLFKQAVEALQIINMLLGKTSGGAFANHPAKIQWEGYLDALKAYYNAHLNEVYRRKCRATTMKFMVIVRGYKVPWFVNCTLFHNTHRASLFYKNPHYYSKLVFPEEFKQHGYFWPSHLEKKGIDRNKLDQYSLAILCNPPELLPRCPAIMKSGYRKGEICYNAIRKKGQTHCGIHNKLLPIKILC